MQAGVRAACNLNKQLKLKTRSDFPSRDNRRAKRNDPNEWFKFPGERKLPWPTFCLLSPQNTDGESRVSFVVRLYSPSIILQPSRRIYYMTVRCWLVSLRVFMELSHCPGRCFWCKELFARALVF